MPILKATRPLNLLILFLTQTLAVYYLGFENSLADVFDNNHLIIYAITQLCAIFGYLLNDVLDYKADEVNRPQKWYLNSQTLRRSALIISLLAVGLALTMAYYWSITLGVFITSIALLLTFYNVLFKRLPLIGNLSIAFLGAFSIFIFKLFDPKVNNALMVMFSFNAFAIHLIREIIKDAEDCEGDSMAKYKTFAVMAGIKATRILIMGLGFVFILGYSVCLRIMIERFFTPPLSYVFIAYNLICIALPFFHLLACVQTAYDKSDFKYLSKVALYIMITGTLSMLFF